MASNYTVTGYAGKSRGLLGEHQYTLNDGRTVGFSKLQEMALPTYGSRDDYLRDLRGRGYNVGGKMADPNAMVGYSFAGGKQQEPQQSAPPSNKPTATAAPPVTYTEPRHLSEQVAKYLGYGGAFGAGGAQEFYNQNPNKQSQAHNIIHALDPGLTNQASPVQNIEHAASQFGYGPPPRDPYQDFLDQVDKYLSQMGSVNTTNPISQQNDVVNYRRPDSPTLPPSLQYLQDLSGTQQRSNIASEGLYGAGTDQEVINYYLDLLQREAIGEDGELSDLSLLPVETQYLQSLGLNYGGAQDFLESVARYYGLLGLN